MFGRGNWAILGLAKESVEAFRTSLEDRSIMAGCSHLPMWEQRDTYIGLVAGWLARHDAHD